MSEAIPPPGDGSDDANPVRTMVVEGEGMERVGGAEHLVIIDKTSRRVIKFLRLFGQLWEGEMDEKTMGENIAILRRHDFPVLPTRIRSDSHVSYPDEAPMTRQMIRGPVEMVRRAVMGIHDSRVIAGLRGRLKRKFEKQITFFRKLYTHTVGWEFIDFIKGFLRTERFFRRTRKRVKYILEQPLFEPAHVMTFGDLMQVREYRDLIYRCICASEEILINPDEQRGVDLLGGKAFKLIFPALNPFCKAMRAEVSNLMIADGDVTTDEQWDGFEPSTGVIAKKGDVRLIDTGLYRLAPRPGFLSWLKVKILRANQEFQNGALWSIVESFGEHEIPKDAFGSIPRRIARFLFGIALPKMKKEAETVKG